MGAIVVGLLIVAVVAYTQLAGPGAGVLVDPGIAYPASIQHDNELGASAAPVTLEVYEDFQCPFCARSSLDRVSANVQHRMLAIRCRH